MDLESDGEDEGTVYLGSRLFICNFCDGWQLLRWLATFAMACNFCDGLQLLKPALLGPEVPRGTP